MATTNLRCKLIINDIEPYFDKSSINNASHLKLISFNLHGFNQGKTFLKSVLDSSNVDLVCVQEHWLSTREFYKLSNMHSGYICFATSAMEDRLGKDVLFGRPYGGTAIFIKKSYSSHVVCVSLNERFTVLKLGNLLITNVYLPSYKAKDFENRSGREQLNDTLEVVSDIFKKFMDCVFICAGDFNCDSFFNGQWSDAI